MFSPPSVCLYAGYLKKLSMDSDETWWTRLVGDKNKPIRFSFRSGNLLFFKDAVKDTNNLREELM